MSRKNESPQKAAMREMMKNYLKDADLSIQDGSDVKNIMRDMMSVLLEGALDGELDDSLGYNKYDYKNKDTRNSRNGHSNKTMHTSYGDMELEIPRDRKGEYEPQIVKKISKHSHSGYGRKNYFHVCKRNDRGRYRKSYARFIWHRYFRQYHQPYYR